MNFLTNTKTNTQKQNSKKIGHNQISEDSPFCSRAKVQRSPTRSINPILDYQTTEGDNLTSPEDPGKRSGETRKPAPCNGPVTSNINQMKNSALKSKAKNTSGNKNSIDTEGSDVESVNPEEKNFIDIFNKLGTKIASAYKVIQNTRNMHKSVRDDVTCAFALYEQLRDVSKNITDHRNIRLAIKQTNALQKTKEVETNLICFTPINTNSVKRNREPQSKSPDRERVLKKIVTVETPRATQSTVVADVNPRHENTENGDWKTVKSRKKERKKEKPKSKMLYKQSEALTIKSNTEDTYAEVLKKMKNRIDPIEVGIQIKSMTRSRNGDILVKFGKGEGQAEKLSRAIGNTLGNDVTTKSVTKSCLVDIRDMDESTVEGDIIQAITTATNVSPSSIKVMNIRESFAKTKQALVKIPGNTAADILQKKKIRIGWIMCRVREKEKIKQCFRCLDQGHLANSCKGEDRTGICRRCCNHGHKSRECKEEIRCILCQKAGLENINHYIGSTFCINNRRDGQQNG